MTTPWHLPNKARSPQLKPSRAELRGYRLKNKLSQLTAEITNLGSAIGPHVIKLRRIQSDVSRSGVDRAVPREPLNGDEPVRPHEPGTCRMPKHVRAQRDR
jgi:hypothetical protein